MYEINKLIKRRNLIINTNMVFIVLGALYVVYLTMSLSLYMAIALLLYLVVFGTYAKESRQEVLFNKQIINTIKHNPTKALDIVVEESYFINNQLSPKSKFRDNMLVNLNHTKRLINYQRIEVLLAALVLDVSEII